MRIRQVTARVFCQAGGAGGNPVTIFAAPTALPKAVQTKLAQQCEWESVMVDTTQKQLSFYMPTGEEVNFCAHAAMGGVRHLYDAHASQQCLDQPLAFTTAMDPHQTKNMGTVHANEHHMVSLDLRQPWSITAVPHPPSLRRLLREVCGLETAALVPTATPLPSAVYPTLVNCSVARPKTLVFVNSLEALQAARAPRNAAFFQRACDGLATTGLYLYTPQSKTDPTVLECRQFPRASQYAEDPATGIAAVALAVALAQRAGAADSYTFTQGTAMGRPSEIVVEGLQFHGEPVVKEEEKRGGKNVGYGGESDDDEEYEEEEEEVYEEVNKVKTNDNDDSSASDREVSFRLRGQVQVDDQQDIEA